MKEKLTTPAPRNTSSIKPEEFETYLTVPKWLVWEQNVFDALSRSYQTKQALWENVRKKPLALQCSEADKGYRYIDGKIMEVSGRGEPVFSSSYLLDPLNEDEVKKFEAEKLLDTTFDFGVYLNPEELLFILQE